MTEAEYKYKLKNAMLALQGAWDNCRELFSLADHESNDYIATKEYPFDKSFDEIELTDWVSSVVAKLQPRYEVVLGFNTKQFWVYDSVDDTYIDPPKEELIEMSKLIGPDGDTYNAENWLLNIINGDNPPEWLFDEDYIYDGETDI